MKNVGCKALCYALGAAILFAAPLLANDYSSQFKTIIQQARKEVEHKIGVSYGNFSPLVSFSRGRNKSCEIFGELCQKFELGAFEDEHKRIKTTFNKFCSFISRTECKIKASGNLKPWDIRYIQWYIEQLKNMAVKAMKQKIQSDSNYQAARLIVDFYNNMIIAVCPILRTYIGTSFERNVIDRIFRTVGFYLGNWWWTIPATAALTKVVWDICRYKEMPPEKDDPKDWDLNKKTRPQRKEITGTFAWYTKLVAFFAGTLFTNAVFKSKSGEPGRIATKYGSYSVPICMDSQPGKKYILRENFTRNEVTQTTRKVEIGAYTKIQIPFQFQSGTECGYYAIYGADCFQRVFMNNSPQNRRRFTNKEAFNELFQNSTKTIIQHKMPRHRSVEFNNFIYSVDDQNDDNNSFSKQYNDYRRTLNMSPDDYLSQIMEDGTNRVKTEWNKLVSKHKQTYQWNNTLYKIANPPSYDWLEVEEIKIVIQRNFPLLWNNETTSLADNVLVLSLPIIGGALDENLRLPKNKHFKSDEERAEFYRSKSRPEPKKDWVDRTTRLGVAKPLEIIARLRYEENPNPVIIIVHTGGTSGHWRSFAAKKRNENGKKIIIFGLESLEKSNSMLEDKIYDTLYHFLFLQEMDGLDDKTVGLGLMVEE
jgi:hypothetical protein